MFRTIRTFLPSLAVLLLVAACSDLPTSTLSPSADLDPASVPHLDEAAGCVTDGVCVLDPIVVGPGECDPYLSLNGCEDQCEESAPGSPEVVGAEGCNDPGTGPGTGGGGTEPPPPGCPEWDPYCDQQEPLHDPCNTGDPMVDAPEVWGQFAEIWARSVDNNVEQGGWIVQGSGSYRLVPFENATFTACGIDLYESPPPGAVSFVHTHPWAVGSVTPCGYINTGTPSEEDQAALAQFGFSVGYFLDGMGIGKFNATTPESADRTLGRCGF